MVLLSQSFRIDRKAFADLHFQPVNGYATYLVGGAVRDLLLGKQVKDCDYVVVGASSEAMLKQGFRQVGGDFPVFLHPQSQQEYALARKERKTAPGYQGFAVTSDAQVTLEDDLIRRDLTINAMAMDQHGNIHDPWHGQADLATGVLRHVSAAFTEDPVRILRAAKFAARLHHRGFTVHPSTRVLMQEMVNNGEVDSLVAERVWQELSQALQTPAPDVFLNVLRRCGALARILPEVDALYGVPQRAQYHPEIDCGTHTELALDIANQLEVDPPSRFAVLTHDLGKALTPKDQWPSHHGHEKSGLEPLRQLCQRLRPPKAWQRIAEDVCEYHLHMHRLSTLRASTILNLLETLNGFRDTQAVERFAAACECDAKGRSGLQSCAYPTKQLLADFLQATRDIASGDIARNITEQHKHEAKSAKHLGAKIKDAIRRQRLNAIKRIQAQYATNQNA